MDKFPIRFTKDGFHAYRNDYKKSSIQGTHVTFLEGCTHALTVAHVPQVLESIPEKESDNLTDLNKHYDTDEQADFISEEEEWATELAIREKEGSPVPKEFPRKTYEQYSFTYASLFSGVGGFEQALNKFGGECVFASEIDKFAAKAYETLYGHKPTGDVTQVDAKDVPDHDLLVGGFPCQAFSVAGKRKGFEDTRGTLFFEIARISKEKHPKALLLENVKGLVNHDKGRTLDVMVRTLNEIGYVVDFDVLNSKYFGVPQNRERIFIVAIRKDLIEAEPFSDEATSGNTIVPKGKRRIGEWAGVFNFDWPEQGEVTTRLRDILESNVDEKYYLDEDKTAKLVAQLEEREEAQEVRPVLTPDRVEKRQNGRRFKEDGEELFTLTSQDKHDIAIGNPPKYRIRKLTPLECFRLQAFPDESHQALVDAGISDSQQYKMAGNAITVNVVEAIAERLIPIIADV